MLKKKQSQAVDLLFLGSPEKVAQKVGVRHSTLQRWLEDRRFQQALKARAKQKRRASERLALQAVMMASSALEAALRTGEDRPVTRAALETLKISGVLPGCLEATRDSADSLADVIARVKAEMDEHG